jgi:hypothetical protein
MPLDVWLIEPQPDRVRLVQARPDQPMVPLSEAIFDELRGAALAQRHRVPRLAKALRVYYGPNGHFEFSPKEAEAVAEELEHLATKPLSPEARHAAEELAQLCRRAAHTGLAVHGYPD